MSPIDRFFIWTGRFSDEQCAFGVLAVYVVAIALFASIAYMVLR
jgi:hypothetical protein